MIDMLMAIRPRHADALRLRRELERLNITAHLPMFALFEINHAIRQEHRLAQGKLVSGTDGEPGISVYFAPIDEAFVHKYFDVNLPERRAGDLIFASLAKGDDLPLITEDKDLARVAASAGIRVFSIAEYEEELNRAAI